MAQLMPLSLASVKSRLVLPFGYRLTRVVPEKEPLNGCVCRDVNSRVEIRNSRVSIETRDFARVCTFYWSDQSWIASRGAKGEGRSPAGIPSCFRLMRGPHRSIDTAGCGVSETS